MSTYDHRSAKMAGSVESISKEEKKAVLSEIEDLADRIEKRQKSWDKVNSNSREIDLKFDGNVNALRRTLQEFVKKWK